MKRRILGLAVLAVGALFVVLGLMDGQYADVFRKAIFVCMECIGIG